MASVTRSYDEYIQYHRLWVRFLERHRRLGNLAQALHLTASALHDLAFDVGLYQRIAAGTAVPNNDPRLAHPYKNLLLALRSLRAAVEAIDRETATLAPPPVHSLDAFDLFEGAILCREHAYSIGEAFNVAAFMDRTVTEPPKALTHEVMVRVGKHLHVGYDVQARLLAQESINDYSALSSEAQVMKRATIEKELKAAYQRPLALSGEALATTVPRLEKLYEMISERTRSLSWILRGLPAREDEDSASSDS